MPSFLEQLPALLRQLADPITPHTTDELWCRVASEGWERCAATLLHELRSGDNDVKRLVLSIICEQAAKVPTTPVQPFLDEIERLLTDDDRLVRIAAIAAIRQLASIGGDGKVTSGPVLALLRKIACHDELPIAREATLTLLENDDGAVREIAKLLRDQQH